MRSILLVDDDNLMRETLAEALRRAGYAVQQCADGKDVVDALKKQPADLLITDLFMEEIDGLGTIMNARKEFPKMKIIAMSGGAQLTDHDYLPIAKRLGAHRTLHKPLNGADLLKTIEELLGGDSKASR
jgi:CheY-like chemotaxis protein